jgi:hypothetical protein
MLAQWERALRARAEQGGGAAGEAVVDRAVAVVVGAVADLVDRKRAAGAVAVAAVVSADHRAVGARTDSTS